MGRQKTQKAERKKQRKGIKLRQSLVSSPLKIRYEQALIRITQFWADANLSVSQVEDIDEAAAMWVENLFFEGEAKGLASDGLASLQHYLPQCCGQLRLSWKLVRAWQKIEPPTRVVPLSPLLTKAFAGACVLTGRIPQAAVILLAFDALLRPGELYLLRRRDITFFHHHAVVTLRDSKSGKRKGITEMVVVNSLVAVFWLRKACKPLKPNDLLLGEGPPSFRQLFSNLVLHFGLTGQYAIYSLRRGGATWDFLMHQSMERTLLRGRWQSTSTARIYLQDTIATVASLKLSPVQKCHARLAAATLYPV